MNAPNMKDFDDWKSSPTGQWFFGRFDVDGSVIEKGWLQEQADLRAQDIGRSMGRQDMPDKDHMEAVRQAGFVYGIEYALEIDPWEREGSDED